MRYARRMRRLVPASLFAVVLTACGDEGKTAPRGAPAAPPSVTAPVPPEPLPAPLPPPSPPSPAPLPPSGEASVSPWASTRVGDSATWEIRVVGSDAVTKLTWRATRVDASGVRYAVQARTLNVEGATKSLVESEELHAPIRDARATPADTGTQAVVETLTIAGRPIVARRSLRPDGKTTVWTSDVVPFSGLVQSTNPDVEQRLVAFSRAP